MTMITEFDKEWYKLYKAQAKLIKKTLGAACSATYHIGSTAIKDMPARAIIDILIFLYDPGAAQKLFGIGYTTNDGDTFFSKSENGIGYTVRVIEKKGGRFLEKDDYEAAAPYLAVPLYLSENKDAAAEFAQKKRALADLDPREYANGMKQLLDEITPVALEYKRAADKRGTYMAIGMCLGMSIGMAIGTALGNTAMGMCLGTSIGMCLGLALGSNQKSK